MTLTHGSVCTGYGGLDLAVEAAFGATTTWVSDIDKGANKIIAHRFPGVPNLGDITTLDWADVPAVDVFSAGTPCQDLSHAGKRAGMTEGTRSNLWVSMREGIAQLRPRFVVWENVRGAYSAEADSDLEHCTGCMGGTEHRGPVLRALGRVLGDLSDLGYDCQWRGLRAADVGACHPRFRVFVIATDTTGDSRGIINRDGEVDANADQLGHEWPRPTRHGGGGSEDDGGGPVELLPTPTPTTQDAANTGGPSQLGRNSLPLNTLVTLLPTPAVNDMGAAYTPDEWDEWTDKMKAAHGNGNGHGKSLSIEAQRLLPTPSVAQAEGGQTSRGGDRSDEPLLGGIAADPATFAQYAPAVARWADTIGRVPPAPTEPTGKGGRAQLSARFVEWMMGLTDGWVVDVPGVTRNEALKACGNGVVPQQAYAALVDMLAT